MVPAPALRLAFGGPAGLEEAVCGRPDVDLELLRRHTELACGDRVAIVTGGGGGWGNPADRTDEEIAADIADGLLSEAQAREVYGR